MNPKEKAIKKLETWNFFSTFRHPTQRRLIVEAIDIAIKERDKEVKEAIDKLAKSIDPYDWANQSGAWNKFLIELGLDK